MHGTVAPPRGMQQLTDALREWLEQSGAEFVFNRDLNTEGNSDGPMAVCLAANATAEYLSRIAPEVSEQLRGIEMLSLVAVTSFYGDEAAKVNGFGCLFPRDQGFRARGVLFNQCIFEGRGPAISETWIFGGALDPDVINLTDEEFKELISREREIFYGQNDEPLALYVNRGHNAIPHYSIELEKILTTLPAPPPNVALVGNYLGRIGLAKLIERAAIVDVAGDPLLILCVVITCSASASEIGPTWTMSFERGVIRSDTRSRRPLPARVFDGRFCDRPSGAAALAFG